jgi:hypothetical protein
MRVVKAVRGQSRADLGELDSRQTRNDLSISSGFAVRF